MAAGYSGTPLAKKLGIKPGFQLLLIDEPAEYFSWMEMDIHPHLIKKNQIPDLIHLFAKNEKDFLKGIKRVEPYIKKKSAIVIWVSWYKMSSGMTTDLNEDLIRNYALKHGLVDIKVCAVSEAWSGLKLVVPLKLRGK